MAKVTISIPNETEQRARSLARRQHVSFSALVSRATAEFADRADQADRSITERIDAAIRSAADDDSNEVAVRASRTTLSDSEW